MTPFLILLTLAVATVTTGTDVYCDVENHEFYVEQWGQCKDCDRCPGGYGLDIKRNINIDPVHGALGCRGCVKCVDGETFSSVIGYEQCKSCTDCTREEKSVATPCTKKRDTVCSRNAFQVTKKNHTRLLQTTPKPVVLNHDDDNRGDQNKEHNTDFNPLLTTFGAVLVFSFVVPSAVILVIKRKRLNCHKQDSSKFEDPEEQDRLDQKYINVEIDPPTETESELNCEARPLTEREDNETNRERKPFSGVSIPGNFSYDNDLETDAEEQKSDPRLNDVPSDKELQDICPDIAHSNIYARLGRELGVKDCEIKRIKEEQRDDLQETAFQTLKKWRELNGKSATKSKLQYALKRVGLGSISLIDDP